MLKNNMKTEFSCYICFPYINQNKKYIHADALGLI